MYKEGEAHTRILDAHGRIGESLDRIGARLEENLALARRIEANVAPLAPSALVGGVVVALGVMWLLGVGIA